MNNSRENEKIFPVPKAHPEIDLYDQTFKFKFLCLICMPWFVCFGFKSKVKGNEINWQTVFTSRKNDTNKRTARIETFKRRRYRQRGRLE